MNQRKPNSNKVDAIVALHDVAPFWKNEIERAMGMLQGEHGLNPALCVVPHFHEAQSWDAEKPFQSSVKGWLREGCELVLHGYTHRQQQPVAIADLTRYLRASALTAGEGEFLNLSPEVILRLLMRGMEVLAQFETTPVGFIPPAWLYNRHLLSVMKKTELKFYEGHINVYRMRKGDTKPMPAIGFCSRDPLRTGLSLKAIALMETALVHGIRFDFRLALHPVDFRQPAMVAAISSFFHTAEKYVNWISYSGLCDKY